MPNEIPFHNITVIAGEDLTGKEGYFVKAGAAAREVVLCSAATDNPIGVLQVAGTTGRTLTVMVQGLARIRGGGNLAAWAIIGTDSTGRAAAMVHGTDTTKYPVGRVIDENTTAGGWISAYIDCLNPNRGA